MSKTAADVWNDADFLPATQTCIYFSSNDKNTSDKSAWHCVVKSSQQRLSEGCGFSWPWWQSENQRMREKKRRERLELKMSPIIPKWKSFVG